MDLENPTSNTPTTGVVSLRILLLAVVATAVIVSIAFLLWHMYDAKALPQPTQEKATDLPVEKAAVPAAPNLSFEDLFKNAASGVVKLQVYDETGRMTKTGSGFVASTDGTIITNYHMIRGAYSERAIFQNGGTADVLGVVGYNPEHDVAAIRVNAGFAKPLPLGDSDKVEVGDRVVAIGSPLGLQNTLSDGLISAVRSGVLQTSTPISHGSSGGPFFNSAGQVVGIAVSTAKTGQNLNFVVPINEAKPYLLNTSLTKLADLTAQNTVVKPLLSTTVEIPAHQLREWPFVIDENQMDNAVLKGSFRSSGGLGGRVRVMVLNQATHQTIYDSQLTSEGRLTLKLGGGLYRVVISNEHSIAFSRKVAANFSLQFVR